MDFLLVVTKQLQSWHLLPVLKGVLTEVKFQSEIGTSLRVTMIEVMTRIQGVPCNGQLSVQPQLKSIGRLDFLDGAS